VAQFHFIDEPKGEAYDQLIQLGNKLGVSVGLVRETRMSRPSEADRIFAELAPYLESEQEVTEWPGTQLAIDYTAIVRTYRLSGPVAEAMMRAARRLFEWENPYLPDDPHFLRTDSSVLLGTVVHEHDAWLDLRQPELSVLESAFPVLYGLLLRNADSA
jgi:hypothetical protein